MEKLLEMAGKAADQAEVFSLDGRSSGAGFENAELHDIKADMACGVSLRVIKDGKLGFAHTRNLRDREELVRNALASLAGGVEAGFTLPSPSVPAALKTADHGIEGRGSPDLVAECGRVAGELKSRTAGEIVAEAWVGEQTLRIANTNGLSASVRTTESGVRAGAIFPGSASGIFRLFRSKGFDRMPQPALDEIVWLFNAGVKEVEPEGGRMKVLFMPDAMLALAWRLMHGASAKSAYEKVSPLAGKAGEKAFSSELSVTNDPLDDSLPGARPFDDEGVPSARFRVVDKGVFQGFYNDLNYSHKLGERPTGHGYRTAMWGGDPLELKPTPYLAHLRFEPGKKSLRELAAMMDRGIILCDALGPHSGNIPNGDFSVGVAPGLYVEKGEIKGRVKDAMISGNVYGTLKEVVAVGSELCQSFGGLFPPLLCDGVSVACR
ncbi:MAG: TldD/PmbA family protein [Elusimicrobia bacterium]|nr:TldD/PmbA family protein [Elusimicrobiota bacterium]